MRAFIFKANAESYDLRVRPQVGEEVVCKVDRYRSWVRTGDLCFFWLDGTLSLRGLYGWGRLASGLHRIDGLFATRCRFEHRLEPFIPEAVVRAIPVLEEHPLFTVRLGDNFYLEDDEVAALMDLIPWAQRPPVLVDY